MARIRTIKPGYRKRAIPQATRRAVAVAAGGVPGETVDAACSGCGAMGEIVWCRLACGKPGSWVQFPGLELDHVIPEVLGGDSGPGNIQLLCRRCNRSKGHRRADGCRG